jgi:tetratricopeptide (TPR) repeat protein
MDLQEALNSARRYQAAGSIAEAEKIYRQILVEQPKHPEVLYELGALLAHRGQNDAAVDLIRRSISAAPQNADAQRNLGLLLAKQGRFDEAYDSLSEAIRLNPNDALAHRNIAKVLAAKQKLDDAVAAFRRAIEIKPDFPEAQVECGYVLSLQSRFEEAIAAFLAGIKGKPNFAIAHLGLGHAYRALGRLNEALASFREAVRINPNLAEAHAGMAMVFATTHHFDEAMDCQAKLARLKSDSAIVHEVMGWICLQKSDGAAAIEHFQRALAIDRQMPSVWNSLGQALLYQGRVDESADCFRHVLEISPNSAIAHKYLLEATRKKTDAQITPLTALLDQQNVSDDDRILAEFALANALDECERYDEAFSHAAVANALVKAQRARHGERFDPEAFHARIDKLIEAFTAEFFDRRRDWGDPSERPVFVVGMPRSGTTLVQQIAASHPQVYGAGELNSIANLSNRFPESDPVRWGRDSIRRAATEHLTYLSSLSTGASRIIDKLPSNLLRLGLISVLFPRARIILCRRDARDTCLSCYFHSFQAGNVFSYDLADCGHCHRENDRLAAHWLSVLPLKILKMRYEDIVADLEAQSRRLIDFLGLQWDPACLEFHRARNTVMTLSVWQVRQPIYQRSVDRWRHYQRHLGLLLEALGE